MHRGCIAENRRKIDGLQGIRLIEVDSVTDHRGQTDTGRSPPKHPHGCTELGKRSREQMEQAQAEVADLAPQGDDRLRMAFLYIRGNGGVFFILGEDDGTRGLIEGLGGIDVASDNGVGAPSPASAEALAELNPEVFIMMTGGLESTGDLEGLLKRPGVAQTIAGQKQRILALPDGQSLAFGPQTGEMLLRSAQALYLGEAQ